MTRCHCWLASRMSHPAGLLQEPQSGESQERWDVPGCQWATPLQNNALPDQSYLWSQGRDTALPVQPSPMPPARAVQTKAWEGKDVSRGTDSPGSAHRSKGKGPGNARSTLVDQLPWKHAVKDGWELRKQRTSILTRLQAERDGACCFSSPLYQKLCCKVELPPLSVYLEFSTLLISASYLETGKWTRRMPQCCLQAEREATEQCAFFETVTAFLPQPSCVGTYTKPLSLCTADQQMKMQQK